MPEAGPAAPVRAGDLAALAILGALGFALSRELSPPLAVAACAVAGVVAVAAPAAALAAIVIALPFAYHPLAIGPYHVSPLELAIGLAVAGAASRLPGALISPSGRGQLCRLATPLAVTVPALVLLAAATLSLATVADPSHLRESLREYRLVIVEPLLAFVAARYLLAAPATRRLVAGALLVTGAIAGAAAVVQFAANTGGVASGGDRISLTYPHPNNLAFFLERAAAFAIGVAVAARVGAPATSLAGRRLAWLGALAALLALAGGATTLSRGFFLAIAVGVAVVVALTGRRRWWRWYLIGLTAVVAAFAGGAWERLVDLGGAGGVPTRLLIWRASLRMALDQPLFGVGLDQFLYQYWPRYVEPAGWPERYTSHPHNLALDLWLRLGILGAAAFAWLAIVVGRMAARMRLALSPPSPTTAARRNDDGAAERRAIGVGAAAALAAGVAHGMVDNGFFLPDLAVLTWLFVALLEAASAADDAVRTDTERARAA